MTFAISGIAISCLLHQSMNRILPPHGQSVAKMTGDHIDPPSPPKEKSLPDSLVPQATIPPNTPCSDNTTAKLLIVSISLQHMWACENDTLVNQSAVTTGMTQAPNGVDDATNLGTWHIYSKQTDQYLRGSDSNGSWDDFVQYWIPFDGAIGFHDASWQAFPFGSQEYKTDGSHGCVHLPLEAITWVYQWAPIGTTVTVAE